MPVRPQLQQLEKCIDDALRKNDFKPLEQFLQMENYEDIIFKCSKQFLSKLDNLMCKELNKKDIQNTSTILNSLGKYGKNISIFGEAGLLVMIKQGLVKKMVAWFEKTKEIILSHKNEKDEAMTNLIEDFFDVLMTVHDINKEGKMEVLENFILRICALVVDMRIHICIHQEAIKKLNAMLDNMPRDAKKIISKPEMFSLMIDMGKRILDAGDYDFQVGITEALCRMTSEKQRRELACQWFSMEFVANAFKGIKDSDFETDCRRFLNYVNGMLGDKRMVFTFPCLSVFLDRYELQIPSDEKLDEFWIDFNLGSRSISFYTAGDDEDHQWETVSVPNDEVEVYSVEVKDAKKLLTLILKNTMNVGNKEGDELLLYFDPSLEISDVTKKIYGANKYREFTRKQAISVAKTEVHIIFDESGSQILVPEGQSSPAKKENFFSVNEKPNRKQQFSVNQKDMIHANQQDSRNTRFQIITPVKRKISEASMVIPGTDKLTMKTLLANTSTPRTGRIKPPLKMVNSAEPPNIYKVKEKGMKNTISLPGSVEGRKPHSYQSDFPKSQPITAAKDSKMKENDKNSNVLVKQNSNGDVDIIADSQPVEKIDKPLLPGVMDNICENNIHSEWTCWTPITNIKICSKESASTSPEETFNQDIVSERVTKKSSLSSISDNITLEKNMVKNQKRKGDVEYNKKKKTKVEICESNRRQPLNNSISLGQENIEKNKENDWHIESETFKSVLLNRTIEKSLIYTKKLVLAKELNNDFCDKTISSGMNAKSNRRPVKGMLSEIRSCDLEMNRKKEKTKEKQFTDAAESLINQINKRYKQKDDLNSSRKFRESLNDRKNSNKPGLLNSKEKIPSKNSKQLKRTTSVNMTSECALNDVYNFNLNGGDDPTIRLGTEEFQTTIKETSVANSKKLLGFRSHDGSEASLKEKDKKTRKNHKKKHLFSDTDTDHRGDDSKTDISWLRESNRKTKPQLVDYSRNKKVKKPKNRKSSPSVEVKLPKSKKTHNTDPTKKVDERITEATRSQRPRRAGIVKKNYKDFSNSESESEQESSPSALSKENLLVQVANMHNKSKTMKQLKKGQNAISTEAEEEISKERKKSSKVKDCVREKRLDSSPIPLSGSPASIEVMRCSEKTIEREFPQDYIPSKKSTSSFSQYSTPEKRESLNSMHGITGNSFYATNMKIQSKCLIESPDNIDKNLVCANKHFSSPLFLPKITPEIMDKIDDSGKDAEIPSQNIQDYDNPVDLSSYNSEKQFSGLELKKIHENCIQNTQKEPLSPSRLSLSSSKREKLYDIPTNTLHRKGSSIHTNLKRLCTSDNLSNSDEVELEEEEERRLNLLPPKLFKTGYDNVTYKVSRSVSTLSANEFSFPGETWETESSGVDIMCQKLSKEFKRKIQNRYKRMDHFNKQSLKSAQQHLTSINYHVHEYRMKQLDKFQFNIIEELESFEKDSQSLKNLEREFSDFWKKTSQKFSAYQKNEQKRVHLLKTSLEKNVFHKIDYEENIFTSQMHLMKEEMKRLQERFLKEMQEEELLNVRRGLMSLFTSDERKF
ncbi:synaptonemal complex protein 2 isoform X5 [Phascolarctos cinereus]|uniref:Synaptonemal complex protein 2 isoform X3 n=1 Tax=Phascolarctos cinereus TaxID=38626 RepID=A0A6P5JYA3_PHACI|nr:synaptonemal complex protein 2 isoform X3 [Phascolarctos cinereus]